MSESVAEIRINIHLVRAITWQHTRHMLNWDIHMTTVHNDSQRVGPGPPHPSAHLPQDCFGGQSMGGPYTIPVASKGHHYRYGGIASDSATNNVTQITGPHQSSMRQYCSILLIEAKRSVLNRLRRGIPPSELWTSRQTSPRPSRPVFSTFPLLRRR
jgi:hypothetical protein